MIKKAKLKGKKIAIVALGGTFYDYILSRTRSEKYDEVWAINGMGEIIKHDRVFMMDPPERFLDDIKAGTQTGIVSEMLKTHEGPIYSCTLDKRCPGVVEYPLEFVVQKTGLAYLNNTVAYALAFAVAHEVKSLHLFGLDFSYADRPHFAEKGIEIGRQSKLTPPEPLDGKQHCHVWGRDDIEGVTYDKKTSLGEKNV